MDNFAETGIAAHWLYKEDGASGSFDVQRRTREWLTGILEMQQNAGDSVEFLENVKVDLFPDELYVYTPEGDIIKLPRDATPVDFAYAVHTDVGNNCVACKLDHRFAPLNTPLYSGQTVEVVTSAGARPNPSWLNYVVTARARTHIRNYLKNLHTDEAIAQGGRLLSRCLANKDTALEDLSSKVIEPVLKEYGFTTLNQLLEDIGFGNRPASFVCKRLFPDELNEHEQSSTEMKSLSPLHIQGTEGMVVSYAKCCHPIPGDHVVGMLSKGKGMVVHQDGCKNISSDRLQHDRIVDVQWASEISGEFSCAMNLHVSNERGVLARLPL